MPHTSADATFISRTNYTATCAELLNKIFRFIAKRKQTASHIKTQDMKLLSLKDYSETHKAASFIIKFWAISFSIWQGGVGSGIIQFEMDFWSNHYRLLSLFIRFRKVFFILYMEGTFEPVFHY